MRFARLREEDGLIRSSFKFIAIIVVVFVVALDAFSLFAAKQTLHGNVNDAALKAENEYVASNQNKAQSEAAARAILTENGARMLKNGFSINGHVGEDLTFSVTGTRHADTYIAHYMTGFPLIGDSITKWLDPVATGDTVRR